MNGVMVGMWTIATLALIAAANKLRTARKRPKDPADSLRQLIGSKGMAARDRNRATSDAKWDKELLESVTAAAAKLRAQGDVAGAEKLEAYAETLRARR